MGSDERLFKTLAQIADAIVGSFPRNLDVVVHDLSDLLDASGVPVAPYAVGSEAHSTCVDTVPDEPDRQSI